MGPGLSSTFQLGSLSLSWPISQTKEAVLQETTTQGTEAMSVNSPRSTVCSLLSLKDKGSRVHHARYIAQRCGNMKHTDIFHIYCCL